MPLNVYIVNGILIQMTHFQKMFLMMSLMLLLIQPLKKLLNIKNRHHDWSAKVAKDSTGKVITGIYLHAGAPLNSCYLRFTEKRRTLPCFAHNGESYYIKNHIYGITDQATGIISKPGDNFISVKLTELTDKAFENFTLDFLDSLNFLNSSIDELVESLKDFKHNLNRLKDALKKRIFSDELIQTVLCMGLFPYEHLKSESVLK